MQVRCEERGALEAPERASEGLSWCVCVCVCVCMRESLSECVYVTPQGPGG